MLRFMTLCWAFAASVSSVLSGESPAEARATMPTSYVVKPAVKPKTSGTISPDSAQTVAAGDKVIFTATANTGYHLAGFKSGKTNFPAGSGLIVKGEGSRPKITALAEFSESYILKFSSANTDEFKIQPSGSKKKKVGSQVKITVKVLGSTQPVLLVDGELTDLTESDKPDTFEYTLTVAGPHEIVVRDKPAVSLQKLSSMAFTPNSAHGTGVFSRIIYHSTRKLFYLMYNGFKAGTTGAQQTDTDYAWMELDANLTPTGKRGVIINGARGDYAIAFDETYYYFLYTGRTGRQPGQLPPTGRPGPAPAADRRQPGQSVAGGLPFHPGARSPRCAQHGYQAAGGGRA